MRPLKTNLLILALSFGCASSSLAGDWPEFRGPLKNGTVENPQIPTTWSASDSVLWRTEIPGQGWSSPVVVGDQIFLTAAVLNEVEDRYELVLLIVDADSGALGKRVSLFDHATKDAEIHKKNSHASPTPIFDGQHLYLHFGHQGTACVDLSGNILWKNDALEYPPVHGNGGSPIVVDNLLIFSRDGADISVVTALDKTTGEIVWETQRDVEVDRKFSFCTPTLLEIDGRRQLIVPGSNVVQSLDPADGREHWRVRYEGFSVIPRPIYESGLVFISTGYMRPSVLAIDPTGDGDVTDTHLKWQSKTGVPNTPSLVSRNGKVAMISDAGIAVCFDAITGEELWKERVGGNYSASPLIVGDNMYLLSEEGVCTILNIAAEPKEVAKNSIGERCLASFAVIENDLLLRSAEALYRISSN